MSLNINNNKTENKNNHLNYFRMKNEKIFSVSSRTISEDFKITMYAVNLLAKRLGIPHKRGKYNANLYTFEDANKIRNERLKMMKSKKSLYTVIYVTQTFHIYESKINFME